MIARQSVRQKMAIVAAGVLTLIVLLTFMVLAWPSQNNGSSLVNAANSDTGQSSTSEASAGNSKSEKTTNASNPAGPPPTPKIAADQAMPSRPNLDVSDDLANGIATVDGEKQSGPGTSELPPGDFDRQAEADKTPTQVVLSNFSSPAAEFFGAKSAGNSFAFVVDISSSMASETTGKRKSNFEVVKQELFRSISALEPNQTFTVICFNDGAHYLPELIETKATDEAKDRLRVWLKGLSADGGTDPLTGMRLVFQGTPEVIFLLSDGEFDYGCVNAIQKLNRGESVINTVSIGMDAATLRQIAEDAAGQYKVVK